MRTELNNLISLKISELKLANPRGYEKVQKWQEESYNRVEEINEIIMEFKESIPFLGLQLASHERMTKKDLVQACKIPMPHSLRKLGQLVSGIFIVEKRPKIMPEAFVPLSADNKTLFALLSHLMCPGVKLDLKPSIVLALVTLNSENSILSGRALGKSLNFLREKTNIFSRVFKRMLW